MNRPLRDEIARRNAFVESCQDLAFITRDSSLQSQKCVEIDAFLAEMSGCKAHAREAGDQGLCNLILGYECVARCLRAEIEMYLLLKQDKPDEAWDALVEAQMFAAAAIRADQGFSHLDTRCVQLEEVEKLFFPPQVFVSAGWIVGRQECSICGNEYGECDHLASLPYWGEFCAIVARELSADHMAIVDCPADKRCRITAVETDGVQLNRMTLLPTPGGVPSAGPPGTRTVEAILSTTGAFSPRRDSGPRQRGSSNAADG